MTFAANRVLRVSLILLVVLTGLTSTVAVVIYRVDARTEAALLDALADEETQSSRAMAREVTQALGTAAADLDFLAAETTTLLRNGRGQDAVASLYESFSRSHPAYDQIRFLDAAGMEQIRVNHREGLVWSTTEEALQDKSTRDYFRNALSLGVNERLITQVEYNRENGQLELPLIPVGRYLAPVSGPGGRRAGFVVLTQSSTPMFRNIVFVGSVAVGDPHIIRGAGTWLLEGDSTSQEEYRLHLEAGASDFRKEYPQAWRAMREADAGSIRTARGLFTHTRIRAAAGDSDGTQAWRVLGAPRDPARTGWHLLSHIPSDRLAALLANVKLSSPRSLALIGGLVIIASLFIALFLERYRSGLRHWRQRATVDALTGLVNRDEFNRRLEQALALAARSHRATAVLFVDLNDFKPLNDEFGHAAGDRALVAVADRLLSACRRSDVVARIGGDEFAVILWEVIGRADSGRIVDKIEAAVAQPLVMEGRTLKLTASVGAATYPDDGRTMETLLHHADMAMYAQKRRRRAVRHLPEAAG